MRSRHRIFFVLAALPLLAGTVDEDSFIGNRSGYWAFRKPQRSPVPRIASNPVDAFIISALRKEGIAPSAALDRTHLIRRVTLDVTGLPPTPAEVDAFITDRSPQAYERLVDRLLASPAYGERWALKWLDIVRYADTNGYELDADRPHAWRYRDYVVDSFNRNKPFDRFVKEQLAGDEIYPDDPAALVATGYLRAGSEHLVSGNIDPDESRQEVLTEIATSIAQTYLGLTVNCARCHNHKFDPIPQTDFYRLQAVFAGAKGKDVEIAKAQVKAAWQADDEAYKARLKPVQDELKALAKPYDERLRAAKLASLEARLRDAYNTPEAKRTPEQKLLAKDAKDQVGLTWDEIVDAMSPADKDRRAALRVRLHEIETTAPDPLPTAYAFVNTGEPAPQSYVLRMGDPKNRLDPVDPAPPRVVKAAFEVPPAGGRRTAFANWLTSRENPLTARVMVNRIWQFRMGRGIVATPNDFGVMGQRPTNQPLLDWLAVEFMQNGWDIRAIDRLILLSNTYRQQAESAGRPAPTADPENRLFWRMNRKRMEGETIRDAALAVAGTLNPKMGGRPVRVSIEPEVYDLIFTEFERDGLWPVSPDPFVRNRRSIYLYNKRSVRLPLLSAFDQPDDVTSCPIRPVSTHALQALTLFNGGFMKEQSEAFAARLQSECNAGGSDCQIRTAWRLALSRPPKLAELHLAKQFLSSGASLPEMCLAILNRNEFVYIP